MKNLLVPLCLILIAVVVIWWYYYINQPVPKIVPIPVEPKTNTVLPMRAGLELGPVKYNPSDYLYGWENYPNGPPWSLGDRRPYLEEERAVGGHFGGGVFSPRDPMLEAKLGGVNIGKNLYSVGGMGGNGHW
jgi:hypothetical protein